MEAKDAIKIAVFVAVALVSVLVVAPKATKPETYKYTIQKLNEKQTNVLEMTAAASTASLALGAIPGDATTPIANKIIDMAGYFIIILSVIILEKYMLTIAGYLTFTWLIPIACGLFVINTFWKNTIIRQLALKILAFGISIVLLVPLSVQLGTFIEKTNEESINSTMESVKEIQKEAEATTGEKAEVSTEAVEEENEGVLDYFYKMKNGIDDLVEDAKEKIDETTSTVAQLSEEAIKKAQDTMNDFVEVVVIMLVTTCGIPMLTLFMLIWIMKTLLGLDLDRLWPMRKDA